MEPSTGTPPNQPIYNIKFSPEQIETLVQRVFPQSKLVSHKQLNSGESFNNRIYFLTLDHENNDNLPTTTVLKVIGRCFSNAKIQNEVSTLLQLKKYCPEIIVPELVAWCEDGKRIHSALTQPNNDDDIILTTPESHKWIMMSTLPGRKLLKEDLLGEHSQTLAAQLADTINIWRTKMPNIGQIGNFRINSDVLTTKDNCATLDIHIEGLLFSETQPTVAVKTQFDYYNHLFGNQINKLNTNDVFTHLRSRLTAPLEDFQRNKLPSLPFLAEAHGSDAPPCFTHQDFAPRNILVKETPAGLQVTGIIDFEFAGMFPQFEEYLNSIARADGDWPEKFWDRLLVELAQRGIKVPGVGAMSKEAWEQGCDLIVLIESIAPWELDGGHVEGDELKEKLNEVGDKVGGLLKKLGE